MLSEQEVDEIRRHETPWHQEKMIQFLDEARIRDHERDVYMAERWPVVFETRNFGRLIMAHWNQDFDELTELERWIEENLTSYGYHPDDKYLMGIANPDEAAAFKMVWS